MCGFFLRPFGGRWFGSFLASGPDLQFVRMRVRRRRFRPRSSGGRRRFLPPLEFRSGSFPFLFVFFCFFFICLPPPSLHALPFPFSLILFFGPNLPIFLLNLARDDISLFW